MKSSQLVSVTDELRTCQQDKAALIDSLERVKGNAAKSVEKSKVEGYTRVSEVKEELLRRIEEVRGCLAAALRMAKRMATFVEVSLTHFVAAAAGG